MCDFASFLITDKGEILVHDMLSHNNTAEYFNLEPETYREAEWKHNEPDSLEVRTLDTDSIVFKKARESILSMFPTRQDFLDKYFTEEVQLNMVKNNGDSIQYIKNPSEEMQLEAVKQYGVAIKFIKNPTEEMQLEAVKRDGHALHYIKNPSEEVQLAAVKQSGWSVKHINNPSEEVQLEAVKDTVSAINYINNPTQKVKDYVKNHS